MKKRNLRKFCAGVLIIALLTGVLPMEAYAKESTGTSDKADNTAGLEASTDENQSITEENAAPPEVLGEIEGERSEYIKRFLMSDHTIQAVVYSEPVHYYEDGAWKDIDNTLTLEKAQNGDDFTGYTNGAGEFSVKIAANTEEDSLVRMEKDNHVLEFNLDTKEKSSENLEGVVKEQNNDLSDNITDSKIADYKDIQVPEAVSDTVLYDGITDNTATDIEYKVTGSGLKENIIVNKKQNTYEYIFHIDAKNLELKLKNNEITAYDTTTGEVVYVIPAPYMYDANNRISNAVTYTLTNTSGEYQLKITADSNWINAKETKYPVTIDPIISNRKNGVIDSTFIASRTPAANYSTYGSALVGVDTYAYDACRTLMKIQLPELNEGDIVNSAYLDLKQYKLSSYTTTIPDMPVNAYRITENWDVSKVTWNTRPKTDSNEVDYNYISTNDKGKTVEKYFDITKAAKAWYDSDSSDSTNFGIMIQAEKDSGSNTEVGINASYYMEDNQNTSAYPMLVLTYRNSKGLENYYSYTSLNAGDTGTAYVNNYTGNMVFEQEGVQTSGLKMPVSVYPVYNISNSAIPRFNNTKQVSGFGWKLNVQQYVKDSSEYGLTDDAHTNYPYVYTDEDGTEHYFAKVTLDGKTVLVDEDGLGLTMKKLSSGYEIADSADTVMSFGSDGNLISIKDANGNTMTVNYTDGVITSVTDGAGKSITITYSSDFKITGMTDPSGRMTKYKTEQGRLTQVTRPDGSIQTFTYDDKILTKITDSSGYGLEYTYLSKEKGRRVSYIQEFSVAKDSGARTDGQKLGFTYNDYNTTKVNSSGVNSIYGDADDVITTYQFDNFGRLTSTYARTGFQQLGASLANYETVSSDNSNIRNANRITDNTSIGANVNNLLLNHNGESLANWETIKTGDSTETIANSTFYHYAGSKSLKIGVASATTGSNVRLRQMLTNTAVVPGKTYTFSGYIRTVGETPLVSGTYGAALLAYCYFADGSSQSFYSDYITSDTDKDINNGWRRVNVTFKVPDNAIKTSVNLLQKGTNGNAYFDALQLEEGNVANSYNFLENSSFENSNPLYGYTTSNLSADLGKAIVADSESNRKYCTEGMVGYKISGEKDKSKYLSQEVAVSGTEKDAYIVSGWAKAYSIPEFIKGAESSVDRRFKISIKVTYSDGTYIWKTPVEFTPDITLWQYGASFIDLNDGDDNVARTPVSISIYPRYDNQANAAYFDNFSITKDNSAEYTWGNGDLTHATDHASETTGMTYSNNDLKSVTSGENPNNSNTTSYNYDNSHNLTSANTQSGIQYNYSYAGGNPTKFTITDKDNTMQIQSDYTYTASGNFQASESDQDGFTTAYTYNEDKGLLQSVTDKNGNSTNYTYDPNNDNLLSVQGMAGDTPVSNTYTYLNGMLDTITHNNFAYQFVYDTFGNMKSVDAGSQNLVQYNYQNNNGSLTGVNYKNGGSNTFEYDTYGNIANEKVNGNDRYHWYSDNSGSIIKQEDLQNHLLYNYEYDSGDRLVRQEVTDTSKPASSNRNAYLTEYGYDDNSNVSKFINKAGSQTLVSLYAYLVDNRLSSFIMPSGKTVSYTYDGLNRLTKYDINTDKPVSVNYKYYTSSRTPGQISLQTTKIYQETVGDNGYQYTYDKLGNIQSISEELADGTYDVINIYHYDQLSQLIREDDKKQDLTRVYNYDQGGNISNIKEYAYNTSEDLSSATVVNINSYEYGDNNWKDKLTAYNGQPITYDEIGNPLTYNGYTLTWSNGRELTTLSGNGVAASYTYDAEGLRAAKTVNGVKTTYQYLGGQLQYEKKGDTEVHYLYDANGVLKGLRTVEAGGTVKNYYVVTNTRGDVTQIYNEAGDLQAAYTYDSWGKILSIKDGAGNEVTSDSSIGKLNSLRYRGYYYDDETGLYYLQSRYYNPEWSRFINKDEVVTIISNLSCGNLFEYCYNNPINMIDEDGYLPSWNDIKNGYKFMEEVYGKFPGFIKNSGKFITSFGKRIPDFINDVVVGEIKNVKYQSLTKQIKGFIEMSKDSEKTFVLIIKKGTKLSGPLIKAIKDAKGIIIELGSDGAKIITTPLVMDRKLLEFYVESITGKHVQNISYN